MQPVIYEINFVEPKGSAYMFAFKHSSKNIMYSFSPAFSKNKKKTVQIVSDFANFLDFNPSDIPKVFPK